MLNGCSAPDADSGDEQPIIGGRYEKGFAAAGFFVDSKGEFSCTGVLVAPDAVVTAAHCSGLGEFGIGEFKTGPRYTVRDIYRHPYYSMGVSVAESPHDLAIVRLATPILDVPVARIAAATAAERYRAVGYGRDNGIFGELGVRKSIGYQVSRVDRVHVVAAPSETGTLCYGDSGGPLLRERDGHLEVAGVTSGTIDPAVTGCPVGAEVGFTNLDAHAGFIQDAIACGVASVEFILPLACQTSIEPALAVRPFASTLRAVKAFGDVTCVDLEREGSRLQAPRAYCAGDNSLGQLGTSAAAHVLFKKTDFAAVLGGDDSTLIGRTHDAQDAGPVLRGASQLGAPDAHGGRRLAGINAQVDMVLLGDALYSIRKDALVGVGQNLLGTPQASTEPVTLPIAPFVSDVYGAYGHGCVLSHEAKYGARKLSCFGSNAAGEIDGTPSAAPKGLTIVPLPRAATESLDGSPRPDQVALGEGYTCAILQEAELEEGDLYCWGSYPGATAARLPTKIASEVTAVVSGRRHVCFLSRTPHVALSCFGENGEGQLGDGTFTDRSEPVSVPLPSQPLRKHPLVAGARHTCIAHVDGIRHGVSCWGANGKGQLGIGDASKMKVSVPTHAMQLY